MTKRQRALLILAVSVLFLALTVWLMSYSQRQHKQRICSDLNVNIVRKRSDAFIIEEDVQKKLMATQTHPVGKLITVLNTTEIEHNLIQNSAIQDVQVYVQPDGKVDIDILQHRPIVRVENFEREQFYLTEAGTCMATDRRYTTRLIVANGYIKEAFDPNARILSKEDSLTTLKNIYELVTFINQNDFLKALIDQIYVLPNQEFEMISKAGNHLILFGSVDNYTDKFDRLEMFYKYGIKKSGWDAYKMINLKFNNQVICTKV